VSRFEHREHLDFYGAPELAEIIRRSAEREGIEVSAPAAARLAAVARGTAREALRLLRRARGEALHRGASAIDEADAAAALEHLGIDERGLDAIDRRCLGLLRSFGTLSLRRLAALVGTDPATIERDHEPHLLRLGLITITPHGRREGSP
jgi:Holliday junction DNA helicase RuvB